MSAFDTILHKGHIGQIYNIGVTIEHSNLEVAKDLIKIFGLQENETQYISFVENRLFNDFRYGMNSDKLRQLGWKQEVDWEEGLKKTGTILFAISFLNFCFKKKQQIVDWYLNNVLSSQDKPWWEGYETALVPHPRRY